MSKIKKLLKRKSIWFLIIFAVFVYLNNSSLFVGHEDRKPVLLAHRGLAQTFSMEGMTNETNTAERINPPEHPYLENTIVSMEAAFNAGADVVELDIQLTKDGEFAVFHDWLLEYRTNGKGNVGDYTMDELKKLDVGYRYTADGGKTYPFRGKGIGLMPTLKEVFDYFPNQHFLIHFKSSNPKEGEQLAEYFRTFSKERLKQFAIYGGDEPVAALKKQYPNMRTMSKASLIRALVVYEAVGWSGYVPEACKNTELHIPLKYARFLWGWPEKFVSRMDRVNTQVVVVKGNGEFSEGFDTPEDIKDLPASYSGAIWTNRIDKIAPLFNKEEK